VSDAEMFTMIGLPVLAQYRHRLWRMETPTNFEQFKIASWNFHGIVLLSRDWNKLRNGCILMQRMPRGGMVRLGLGVGSPKAFQLTCYESSAFRILSVIWWLL